MAVTCAQFECVRPACKRGLCGTHYSRARKTGAVLPLTPAQKAQRRTARFWSRVDRSAGGDACWPWLGGRDQDGYGTFYVGTVANGRAHRLSWEFLHGPVPAGLFVCHKCDNPPCVNPAHLFVGTVKDNNRDRANKGRHGWFVPAPRKGAAQHASKLTDSDVIDIRTLRTMGARACDLRREFGISGNTLYGILNRKGWRHVP